MYSYAKAITANQWKYGISMGGVGLENQFLKKGGGPLSKQYVMNHSARILIKHVIILYKHVL